MRTLGSRCVGVDVGDENHHDVMVFIHTIEELTLPTDSQTQ